MKIPLSQGKFAIVGPRDYKYLMQWRWCYSKCRKDEGGYAVRHDKNHLKNRLIYMHCMVLERMGYKDFVHGDHINRDKLDNRRYNLRSATACQSAYNRGKQRNNTSGYIGVYWDKQLKKWRARIMHDKKNKHIGLYDDVKDAARARDKVALKLRGKFTVLNEV